MTASLRPRLRIPDPGFRIPLFLALLLPLFLSACSTRGPASQDPLPPLDPARPETISAAATNPELQLARPGEYTIGPGDILAITLVGRPDILGEDQQDGGFRLTVSESPTITLPLIGAIRVHGKTAQQLQEELRAAYASFIQNPRPIVTVEKYHFNQVAVLGAVQEPGKYPLTFGDTLLEGIFKAGGLTFGGQSGGPPPGRFVKVYRERASRRALLDTPLEELMAELQEGGRIVPREEIVVPLERFLFAGEMEFNIPLQPNDIIYVPPAGTIIVQGHVRRPGVLFLGPSLRTVGHALTESGGMRWGAASRVEVVRTLPSGQQQSYYLNGREALKRTGPDFVLSDMDELYVYRHPVRGFLEDFSSVFRATVTTGANATYNPVN